MNFKEGGCEGLDLIQLSEVRDQRWAPVRGRDSSISIKD
jgi:hypothetical protein